MPVPRDLDALTLADADPGDLLRTVAGAGARLRAAVTAAREAGLSSPADRPRSVVVVGRDAAAVTAALVAVAGPACPVPVLAHVGPGLPGFVGPLDLVVLLASWPFDVAAAATAEETGRRGARLVAVAPGDSVVTEAVGRARGELVELPRGPVSLWSLLGPALVVAAGSRVLSLTDADLEAAADRLDAVAVTCRPDAEVFANPAKSLAGSLVEGTPVLWGSSDVTAAAALAGQAALLAHAGLPSLAGHLPGPGDGSLGVLDASVAPGTGDELEDLFRDRLDDEDDARPGPVVVMLRDATGDIDRDGGESPGAAARAEVIARVAGEQHHAVHVLAAAGESRLERFAAVAGLLETTAVYAALAAGRIPGDGDAVAEIAARLRR